MSKYVMKWLTGLGIALYILLVMFHVVPQMVSAKDTVSVVLGVSIFVLSIPAITIIVKKVFE